MKVETKLDNLDEKLDDRFNRLHNKLNLFIEGADDKFASKLTEKIVYTLCGIILLGFVGAMTKLVGLW